MRFDPAYTFRCLAFVCCNLHIDCTVCYASGSSLPVCRSIQRIGDSLKKDTSKGGKTGELCGGYCSRHKSCRHDLDAFFADINSPLPDLRGQCRRPVPMSSSFGTGAHLQQRRAFVRRRAFRSGIIDAQLSTPHTIPKLLCRDESLRHSHASSVGSPSNLTFSSGCLEFIVAVTS